MNQKWEPPKVVSQYNTQVTGIVKLCQGCKKRPATHWSGGWLRKGLWRGFWACNSCLRKPTYWIVGGTL